MRLLMAVFSCSFPRILLTLNLMNNHTAMARTNAIPIRNHVFSQINFSITNETCLTPLFTPYLLIACNCRVYVPDDKDGKASWFSAVVLQSDCKPSNLYL